MVECRVGRGPGPGRQAGELFFVVALAKLFPRNLARRMVPAFLQFGFPFCGHSFCLAPISGLGGSGLGLVRDGVDIAHNQELAVTASDNGNFNLIGTHITASASASLERW